MKTSPDAFSSNRGAASEIHNGINLIPTPLRTIAGIETPSGVAVVADPHRILGIKQDYCANYAERIETAKEQDDWLRYCALNEHVAACRRLRDTWPKWRQNKASVP